MCQRPVQQRGTVLAAQLMPLLQTSVYPRRQKVSPEPVRGPETHMLLDVWRWARAISTRQISRLHFAFGESLTSTSFNITLLAIWRAVSISTAGPSPFFAFL